MERQVQLSTESAILSREAVQIRMLITDLNCTVQILDADFAAEKKHPRLDDLVLSHTRRNNLMVTIACLEDHLGSIERMRSRGYGAQARGTVSIVELPNGTDIASRSDFQFVAPPSRSVAGRLAD